MKTRKQHRNTDCKQTKRDKNVDQVKKIANNPPTLYVGNHHEPIDNSIGGSNDYAYGM